MAHSYCVTAFVLRSQKIYCKECFAYFRLYVKSERILNSAYLTSAIKMAAMFAIFGSGIYGIYYLDLYLKAIDKRDIVNNDKKENGEEDYISIGDAIPQVQNSFIVVPLIVVLVIIMAWCFYLRFVMAFMKRKRLVWVEV